MSSSCPTDVLLWRLRLPPQIHPPQGLSLAGGLQPALVAWSPAGSLLYVYAQLPHREPVATQALAGLTAFLAVDGALPVGATPCRLERVLDLTGASDGQVPSWHYVVETDAEPGWMDEIARWYRDEHLPGLAAVPGCVRARRYINHDDARRSFACYDLLRPGVLDSPQWLAVRGTEWSSRTRPHFANTVRSLFQLTCSA